MAVALACAVPVAIIATGQFLSAAAFAGYIALPVVGTAAGLLVVTTWVRLAPARFLDSWSLGVAMAASYLPHLAGVVVAVSAGVALMTALPDRLQPMS